MSQDKYAHALLQPCHPLQIIDPALLLLDSFASLEFLESLDGLAGSWQDTEDVESDLKSTISVIESFFFCWRNIEEFAYSLAERSALTDGDCVTFFNTESRRDVGGEVSVSLLVSGVLGDEVKVFSADDQSSVHLGRDDSAGEDTASDRDHTGERAFLVYNEKYFLSAFLRLFPNRSAC